MSEKKKLKFLVERRASQLDRFETFNHDNM